LALIAVTAAYCLSFDVRHVAAAAAAAAAAETLLPQAALLEKEEDGAKRAMTYHNILRLLIQKALDLSLQQCNPEVLVQGTVSVPRGGQRAASNP
jgi:hypothetical protein